MGEKVQGGKQEVVMKISKTAVAGTLESNDLFVTVEPSPAGCEIEIESIVKKRFGDQIEAAVQKVLDQFEVENAKVSVMDRGAIDCTIMARVETAILRAKGE